MNLYRTPNIDASELGTTGSPREPQTILVVDDHSEICHIASLLFERYGYRVLTATNGEGAKSLALANPDIALLLSDLEMPGISGDQLAIWLRAARPRTEIILMSGNFIRLGELVGFKTIEKPFVRLDLLIQTVREALKGSDRLELAAA